MRIPFRKSLALQLTWLAALGCQPENRQRVEPQGSTAPSIEVGVVPERVVEKTIILPATINSDEVAMLVSKIEAYVDRVLVDIGDEVRAGQTLVELYAPELQQRANQVRRQIEQLQAGEIVLRAQRDSAFAALQTYKAELTLRGSERDRLARLVNNGAIGRQRLEEAEFAALSVEAEITEHQNAMRVAEARIQEGAAEMAVAQALLAEAETLAGYLTINAPFDGIVTKRNVDPGNLVSSDDMSGALVTVAKIDQLRAVMYAAADVAGRLKIGQSVRFISDDAHDQVFEAPIARLSGAYDPRTRMMRVEVDLANASDPQTGTRPLRAGSYGTAEIVVATTGRKTPAAPPAAIRTQGGQPAVFVVADGTCRLTLVTLGLEGDDVVEIKTGVAPGTQIVATGVDAVKDQQPVSQEQVKPTQW
ncbi:efflux RND transporter periplasmic adaptor subunit [Pirellulales bacterium]|nr:efflux RND transporter periplasmic adaptor subunit [Pirellulales bacterium]